MNAKRVTGQNHEEDPFLLRWAKRYALHLLVAAAVSFTGMVGSALYAAAHPFVVGVSSGPDVLNRVGALEYITVELQKNQKDAQRQHSLELGAELIASPKFAAAYEQTLKNKLRNEYDTVEKAATRKLMDDAS